MQIINIPTHTTQDTAVTLNIDTTMSMIDGKMVSILQGDSGSPCHYCDFNVEGINDLINILQGFLITKSFESCCDTWDKVLDGDITWHSSARAGQCHKPLLELKIHAVLHWKLRSFDFLLQVYYRLIAGSKKWGESDKRALMFVKSAKENAIDHLRKNTGMLIDTPTSNGGNTNNGMMAERFLHPKNREIICSLILNGTDRENFEVLLRDMNIILSITQSTRDNVDTTKLRQLGIDIMSHIRSKFIDHEGLPWININPSLHAMCGHSWQLIDMLNAPVAMYSEQAQEHWNKYIAKYKSGCGARARQHDVGQNISDIFKRMLLMTHPKIWSKQRIITCGTCGKDGHTSKSVKFHGLGPKNWEDAMIENYYMTQ